MRSLAALALGCLALAAATAHGFGAAPALEVEFSKRTLKRNTHASATARCDRGTEVVSNGFAAPDRVYAGGGPYTYILGAARKGEREFVVRAENFSSTRGQFYAYAYCADLGSITVADASRRLESRRDGVVTARCPGGRTAISGGWAGRSIDGGRPQMVPFLSKRAGANGWKVGAENGAFKGAAKLTAYAYCADLPAVPQATVHDVRMPQLSMPSAGSSCRGGREAIAGGFDAATPRGFSVGASVFTSRRKKGGVRWKVEVINGGHTRHLRVYAYCL
ncbi:MAG: hypothetical protein ABWY79_00160 [Solirubrobacterales bacterium]